MTFDEYKKLKKTLKESDKYNFVCDKFNIFPILLAEIIEYQTYYIFNMLAVSDRPARVSNRRFNPHVHQAIVNRKKEEFFQ